MKKTLKKIEKKTEKKHKILPVELHVEEIKLGPPLPHATRIEQLAVVVNPGAHPLTLEHVRVGRVHDGERHRLQVAAPRQEALQQVEAARRQAREQQAAQIAAAHALLADRVVEEGEQLRLALPVVHEVGGEGDAVREKQVSVALRTITTKIISFFFL